MPNNSAIIRELRIIGERWNIPLLYQAADALDRLCARYDQLWRDHNHLTSMCAYQEKKLMDLERENIALKIKIDQLWRENQLIKRQPLIMIGGKIR